MIPVTDEGNESYRKQRVCYICKKEFIADEIETDDLKMIRINLVLMKMLKMIVVKDRCHYRRKFRGAAHNICSLRYKTPKKIALVFCNGSTYDYHFISNQLAKKFKGQF